MEMVCVLCKKESILFYGCDDYTRVLDIDSRSPNHSNIACNTTTKEFKCK